MTVWYRPTALPIDPFGTPDRGYATFRVTSPWGYRDNPLNPGTTVFHGGLDIGNARLGDSIVAVADGRVEAVGNLLLPWSQPTTQWPSGNYGGLMTVLDHGTHISLYAHQRRVLVTVGQQVRAGQPIGEVGESGSATGRGHLHFGISNHTAADIKAAGRLLPNAWTVDPWPLIERAAALAEGIPSTALRGDPMLRYKSQGWVVGEAGANHYDTPNGTLVGAFPAGTLVTSIGEYTDSSGGRWRAVIRTKNEVNEIIYCRRADLGSLPGQDTGDPAFDAAVLKLLLARQAPTTVDAAQVRAETIEQAVTALRALG